MMHAVLPGAFHHLESSLSEVDPYLCQLTPDRRLTLSHHTPCPYSDNGHRELSLKVEWVLLDQATLVLFAAVETCSIHGQPLLAIGHRQYAAAAERQDLIADVASQTKDKHYDDDFRKGDNTCYIFGRHPYKQWRRRRTKRLWSAHDGLV